MPLLSHQVDGERANALGLQFGSESREIRCSRVLLRTVGRKFGAERVPARHGTRTPQTRRVRSRRGGAVTLRELVAELVAIDSVNPELVPGGAGELEIARFIAALARGGGRRGATSRWSRPAART